MADSASYGEAAMLLVCTIVQGFANIGFRRAVGGTQESAIADSD